MPNIPWAGLTNRKLFLQSGDFGSTLKKSFQVADTALTGIEWGGTNTFWSGNTSNLLYKQSGQFTSTIKDTINVAGVDGTPTGISWDGRNTPWCGTQFDDLVLNSKFTSTELTRRDLTSVDTLLHDISFDGDNTPWCGVTTHKLYVQEGQFTSSILKSLDIIVTDSSPTGISWDGTDTLWCGIDTVMLYRYSGQFTSTVKSTMDVSGFDSSVQSISTNNFNERIAKTPIPLIYVSSTLTITDGVLGWTDSIDIVDTLTITDTFDLTYNVIDIIDYLAISDTAYQPIIYDRAVTDTLTVSDSVDSLQNSYTFSDFLIIVDYVDLNDVKERTAGNVLVITDSVSIEQDYAFKIIDPLAISDSTDITVPLNIVIEHTLTISDEPGGVFQYNLDIETPFDILFTDPVNMIEYRMIDSVEHQLIAGRVIVQHLTAQQTVQVTNEKASATSDSASNTLTITDEAVVARSYGHTLVITDSITVTQGKGARNDLTITDSIVVSRKTNNTLTDVLTITNEVRFTLTTVGPCPIRRLYFPFIGTTTDPDAPTPPSVTPPTIITYTNVQLSWPTTAPSLILTLRGPELGNRDQLHSVRINRETRGGTLVVYADPDWPKREQLNLQFTGLTESEGEDILEFLRDTLGQQIKLRDWEGKEWTVLTVSPGNPFTQRGFCKNAISLDFESAL